MFQGFFLPPKFFYTLWCQQTFSWNCWNSNIVLGDGRFMVMIKTYIIYLRWLFQTTDPYNSFLLEQWPIRINQFDNWKFMDLQRRLIIKNHSQRK